MNTYTCTKESLEEIIEQAKIAILSTLSGQGLICEEEANKWCENHTIILRDKNVFRTLTDKWIREKESGPYLITVKRCDKFR